MTEHDLAATAEITERDVEVWLRDLHAWRLQAYRQEAHAKEDASALMDGTLQLVRVAGEHLAVRDREAS